VNGTLIVETALGLVAIDPATRAYVAISKERAARAKARRDGAFVRQLASLDDLLLPRPTTTAVPAAGNAPAGAAGSNGAAPPQVLAARALDVLGDTCRAEWRQVAQARIADPAASWAAIGDRLGTTAAGARCRYQRMVRAAGVTA
jgi:hypothetical protein